MQMSTSPSSLAMTRIIYFIAAFILLAISPNHTVYASPLKPSRDEHTPYVAGPGPCSTHVTEYWSCFGDEAHNLSVEVTIWDVAGNQIGYVNRTIFAPTWPLRMKSKLEDLLVVTPQPQNDLLQFVLGQQNWTSLEDNRYAPAWCEPARWWPRGGPECYWFGLVEITVSVGGYMISPCPCDILGPNHVVVLFL